MSASDRLLDALQRAHDGQPWHGPSRGEVLRDVANRAGDPPQRGITQRAMIRSLAEHDVYHTGQLALLKRIARDALSP